MDIRSVIVSIFATLAVSAGAGTLYVDVATGNDPAAVRCMLVEAGDATVIIKVFSLCDGARVPVLHGHGRHFGR